MKKKYDYFLVILGGGSAGLTIAKNLALFNTKILLIEKEKLGGDCLNKGCVPSKSFIQSVGKYHDIIDQEKKLSLLKKSIKSSIDQIAIGDSKYTLNKLGISVEIGDAQILDSHNLKINNKKISFKNLVFTVGSRVNDIKFKGLEKSMYLNSDSFWNLEKIYDSIAIIGSGAIALELGSALNVLGTKINYITQDEYILNDFDVDVHNIFKTQFLNNKNMKYFAKSKIKEFKKHGDKIEVIFENNGNFKSIKVDKVFLATGRISNANLIKSNIKFLLDKNNKFIVNNKLKLKKHKNFFAAGDCVNNHNFTHTAGYEASIILRNFILKIVKQKINKDNIIWNIFTQPQISFTGLDEKTLKKRNINYKVIKYNFEDIDHNIINNYQKGLIKIFVNKKGLILGAIIVNEEASNLIHLIKIMIDNKIKMDYLIKMMISYPSNAYGLKYAAIENYYEFILNEKTRNLLSKLFLKY